MRDPSKKRERAAQVLAPVYKINVLDWALLRCQQSP